MKNKMKKENIIILVIILLIILLGFYLLKTDSNKPKIGKLGSIHEHAEFMVYLNGENMEFNLPEYMVMEQLVHIEDMDGKTIHKHATGITIGYFFESLGFELNKQCFIMPNGDDYCNNQEQSLKVYINGERNYDYVNYEIRDEDKYLITYGSESEEEIQEQLASV